MDVAKVVAVLLCGGQALSELYGVDQVAAGRLPLVLVPTTAGTGSEVTPVPVITTGETTKAGMSLLACRVSEEILAPLPEAPIGNTRFAGHLLEAVLVWMFWHVLSKSGLRTGFGYSGNRLSAGILL